MNDKSSCIDLLFITNSKLLCDVGVEQIIYKKCYHNIIYGSLNLNTPLPLPYSREVWDYKNTDAVCIQRAISLVNWNDIFINKTGDEKVISLSNILLNIFRNWFLIRLSNSIISIPRNRILRLFNHREIGPNWPKAITLIQLKRIKTFFR